MLQSSLEGQRTSKARPYAAAAEFLRSGPVLLSLRCILLPFFGQKDEISARKSHFFVLYKRDVFCYTVGGYNRLRHLP